MIKTILATIRGHRQETEVREYMDGLWGTVTWNVISFLTLRWKEVFLQRAALERRLTENRREPWPLQTFLFYWGPEEQEQQQLGTKQIPASRGRARTSTAPAGPWDWGSLSSHKPRHLGAMGTHRGQGHCCQVLQAAQELWTGQEGETGPARVKDMNFSRKALQHRQKAFLCQLRAQELGKRQLKQPRSPMAPKGGCPALAMERESTEVPVKG